MSKHRINVNKTDRTLNDRFGGMASNVREEVVELEGTDTMGSLMDQTYSDIRLRLRPPPELIDLELEANSAFTVRRTERNTSTESLESTDSSDIESVGTYESFSDDCEDMSELFGQYFGPNNRRRTVLPITEYEKQIMDAIHMSQVVVIEGATGCGKTTQVPQFIADNCAAKGVHFNIVVTQPRRIAAKSIATRVAEERDWQLGSIVGYQIGLDRQFVGRNTRLLYCTTGLLLQRLIHSKRIDDFTHIVIDEIHERSIETDLLLLVIKKLMTERSASVRLVLMSATFDPQSLIDYFTIPTPEDTVEGYGVRPIHIKFEERAHTLDVHYMSDIRAKLNIIGSFGDYRGRPNINIETIGLTVAILERDLDETNDEENRGSVLIFLPGIEEIYRLKGRLNDSKKAKEWTIHVLHSSVPLDRQSAVFTEPNGRERKIILATNIAESSITVPDVSYVIDFCLNKTLVCDRYTNIPVLTMEWASKANCDQRAGRAGRVNAGRVYRLVDEEFYESLHEFSRPDILRSPLELAVLKVKMLGMGSPNELLGQALDPPDLRCISNAVLQLKHTCAFGIKVTNNGQQYYDRKDGDITTLGQILSYLPIDIRLGKLIVFGHLFDVLEDCIIISACLSTEGIFCRDFSQGLKSYKSLLAWADRSLSDGITYLNAYKKCKQFGSPSLARNWCGRNLIQYQRIKEAENLVNELIGQLRRHYIRIPVRPNLRRNPCEDELIIKVVMCAAFYPNYFTRNPMKSYAIHTPFGAKNPFNSVLIEDLPPNEGPLYADAIRELFSVASKQMDIDFNSTSACLTFHGDCALKEALDPNTTFRLLGKRSIPLDNDLALTTISSQKSSEYTFDYKKHLKDSTVKSAVYVAIAVRKCPEIMKQLSKGNRTERRDEDQNSAENDGNNYSNKKFKLEFSFDSNDKTTDNSEPKPISFGGPNSAFECSFSGLTPQTSTRSVKILRDSVNWVVLEPNYWFKQSRLLVASGISLHQNTGQINLRDTTLMPDIKNLPALMAMLFAPTYDLEYLPSVTCGLGYDDLFSVNRLDPDSDLEILIDSHISREDLIKVEVIRNAINNVLKSREELKQYTEGSLAELQRKLRSNVIQLLSRRSSLADISSDEDIDY